MRQRVSALFLILPALFFCPPAAADIPVVIVMSASIGQGLQLRLGVEAAVEAINRSGGLLGQKVRATFLDDACDPDQAAVAAQRALAETPGLIVGHDCSAASIRAAPIYAAAGVIHISPVTTNPKFTELGIPTLFRTVGRDDREAAEAARLIAKRWPHAKLAVLDDGRGYGKGLAETLRNALAARGIKPVFSQSYKPAQPHYGALVDLLRRKAIDLLYLTGYSEDMGLLLHEIRAAGLTLQALSGDSGGNRLMPLTAGSAADGMIFTSWRDPLLQPGARKLVAEAAARGLVLDGDAALGYAAVEIWAQAAGVAGSPSGPTVAENIHRGRFETLIGTISFDAKGDVVGPRADWVWYRWQGGHAIPLSQP